MGFSFVVIIGLESEVALMNPMQIMSMLNQFRQNPMSMLAQKYNLPPNMTNPQEIINHLLNTNQINQQQIDQAKQMSKQFFGTTK